MRLGRLLAELGRTGLVDHHRFGGRDFACDLQEALTVAKALDIERGDTGVFLFAEILQVVVEADVGLVAGTDIGREADMAIVFSFQHQSKQHVARLRNEADVSRLDVGQREQVDLFVQVEHARRVRTDDAHISGACGIEQFLFEFHAVAADLAKTARQDDGALDALAPARLDQVRHGARRRADQREVDRTRNSLDRGEGFHAEHHVDLGVDRVDRALIAILDQADHRLVTTLGRIGRGTDDGDRVRGEKVVQRAGVDGGGFESVHVILP